MPTYTASFYHIGVISINKFTFTTFVSFQYLWTAFYSKPRWGPSIYRNQEERASLI